jgi:hypothetical protein
MENNFENYINERITLFCANYIYSGRLSTISKGWLTLSEAGIVYETGPFDTMEWQDYQRLPNPVSVNVNSVESIMILK